VTRVRLLIYTNYIYSDTIMTDLRPSPRYEFGKKETCPNNAVTLENNIRFVYHMF
jgi:hypothetical protein